MNKESTIKNILEAYKQSLFANGRVIHSRHMEILKDVLQENISYWYYPDKDEYPEVDRISDSSVNVLAVVDRELRVMAYCYIYSDEDSGYAWCDCNMQIDGATKFDANYTVEKWTYLPNF